MFLFAAPFTAGVVVWAFYAFQPYVLQLSGDPNATYLSGIAAAVFALAQIVGGSSVRLVRRVFSTRTSVLVGQAVVSSVALIGVGLVEWLKIPTGFWVAIALMTTFWLIGAMANPLQQALLNDCIPSGQRATVLSFVSLTGSAGGVVVQPALGKVADVYSLGVGYVVGGVTYALSLPFVIAVRRMGLAADRVAKPESTMTP
jgi:hypothetical protein